MNDTINDTSMRAIVISAARTASLTRIPRWLPDAGQIVVRCRAAGVCTTERQLYAGRRDNYPAVGGHEVAGVVEEVNEPSLGLRPGDRVTLDAVRRCGQCLPCQTGNDHRCDDMSVSRRYGGFARIGGGFAEYTVIPAKQAIKIPDDLSFEEAALAEPLACCLHSIRKAVIEPGQRVCILGAGFMGLLHLKLVQHAGARAFVTDLNEARLAFAKRLGADEAFNVKDADPVQAVRSWTNGLGADAVFVTAGDATAASAALNMVGRGGRIVFFASVHPSVFIPADWNRIHYDEVIITGSASKTAREFRDAVGLLADRAITVHELIGRVISLEALPAELDGPLPKLGQRVVVRH